MEIETCEEDFSLGLLCIRNGKNLNHRNMILSFCNRTLVTTWKHSGRKDCNWRGSASFIRVCLWSGPLLLLKGRGWPWLEYDNVSNCFEKRGYVCVRTFVCRGMVSRIKGVILGPLCQDVHPLRVFDPAFTTMACTLMASKGGYFLETLLGK